VTVYATLDEVRDRVDPTYAAYPSLTDDDTALKLILKASELIDEHSLGRSQVAYDVEEGVAPDPTPYRSALARAVADQVEFWLEVGPEHDVAGLKGSLVAGRLQVHPVANTLAPRAKRTLMNAGLYWAGANIG
jgi:hypothetical protein